MITICKGEHTLEVTNGAFRNFYQRIGYKPVRGSRSVENPGEVNTHSGEVYLEDEVPLAEIPISEMTHSQLFEYAEQLGLEFEADASAKALRKLIRQHTT